MSDFSLYLPPNSISKPACHGKAGPEAMSPKRWNPGSGPQASVAVRIGPFQGSYPLDNLRRGKIVPK